jgi:hypothetical protein
MSANGTSLEGAHRGPAVRPEITLIKKSGPNPVMSKRIFLDEQGKVCSDGSQCLMAQGTATRAAAETAADLAKHIMACGTEQAIALGALRADLANLAKITTLAKLKDNLGAITRFRDFIDYRPGAPAWALIDFDTKGMPLDVAASIEAAGGMWNVLRRHSSTHRAAAPQAWHGGVTCPAGKRSATLRAT